jgi:hypothetical protein
VGIVRRVRTRQRSFSPAIAARLRERGHDVIGVADDPDLRSMPDEVLWTWAGRAQTTPRNRERQEFSAAFASSGRVGRQGDSIVFYKQPNLSALTPQYGPARRRAARTALRSRRRMSPRTKTGFAQPLAGNTRLQPLGAEALADRNSDRDHNDGADKSAPALVALCLG